MAKDRQFYVTCSPAEATVLHAEREDDTAQRGALPHTLSRLAFFRNAGIVRRLRRPKIFLTTGADFAYSIQLRSIRLSARSAGFAGGRGSVSPSAARIRRAARIDSLYRAGREGKPAAWEIGSVEDRHRGFGAPRMRPVRQRIS